MAAGDKLPLETIIEGIISLKEGSREMVINYRPGSGKAVSGSWNCGIGNQSSCVALNEVAPEVYSNDHPTVRAALLDLQEQLEYKSAQGGGRRKRRRDKRRQD